MGYGTRDSRPALLAVACALGIVSCSSGPETPSARSRAAAEHADSAYFGAAVATLADLVAFRTVRSDTVENAANPEFRAMSAYLEEKAAELGLDFTDHGSVVVIGLGDAPERLGLSVHGDVVPADPSKWAEDPFSLDTLSEPGRLVGRGSIDDKGSIAAALYAMKAVKDRGLPLRRRVELVISYTEESDWAPYGAFLAENPPPGLNVGFDSEYPVVIAEKGWNSVHLGLAPVPDTPTGRPRLVSLEGGAFLSQVPEDAAAAIDGATRGVERRLREAAGRDSEVQYTFASGDGTLTIRAQGQAAHSSQPETGRNAITHLAAVLGSHDWPDGQAARTVRLINDLVGTGDYGERFGEVAMADSFMGPLTLTLATLAPRGDTLVAGISIRSPVGRSPEEMERILQAAVDDWSRRTGIDVEARIFTSAPYYLQDAPHVPTLLAIFETYTGHRDPQPVSIGGGTTARLLPNGVNFGPSMPGEPYLGHSEHEYISRDQFRLNLKMYTALIAELAGGDGTRAQGDASPDPAGVARAIIAADNAGDLEAVLALYAANAELWPPGEPPVRGRERIKQRYEEIFASTRLDLRTRITRVRHAEGWALVEGVVQGSARPRSEGEPLRVNDKYLMVLERANAEAWKITLLMWSPNEARAN